jgi:hypothetical protein
VAPFDASAALRVGKSIHPDDYSLLMSSAAWVFIHLTVE